MQAASARAAVAAVTFLTRVPIGRHVVVDAADVARGAVLFPVVGAAVGAVAGLAAAGLEGPLPPLLAGGLAVGVAALLTGALHLDALADTADALGARTTERALEIMRDPRIGTFGVVALAVTVLVEADAIGSLAGLGDAVAGFATAGALSRAVAPPIAVVLPYARGEERGTGKVLSGRVSLAGSVVGCALAVGLGVLLLGWDGLVVAGAVAMVATITGAAWRIWLGGITGDTLGATIQLAEMTALVTVLVLR